MFCLLGSDTEQHVDVAAQMIDGICGDLCSARCLGEDEGALDDGVCISCLGCDGGLKVVRAIT